MLDELKQEVCAANLALVKQGLVTLCFGNASGLDRAKGLVVIKPSGVSYDELRPDQMVVLNLDGTMVEGDLRPSSDTPTHLALYRAWPSIGGLTHTHSTHATTFAQARREVPCFGTTHADYFRTAVPLTRHLTEAEVGSEYEANTGAVIIERFEGLLDPMETPAVLVANHGPFTWGLNAKDAVTHAVALESVAQMALGVMQLDDEAPDLQAYLIDKHYLRKHGPDAYYGQGDVKH